MKTLRLFHDVKNGLGLYIGRENTESRGIRVSRGWHDSFTYIGIGSRKSYDSLTLLIGVDMLKYNHENRGEFEEHDRGCWFTYRKTEDAWALSYGLTHEIDVLDGIRFAIIKKTCAHICTSEDDTGKPILENWKFRKHTVFY